MRTLARHIALALGAGSIVLAGCGSAGESERSVGAVPKVSSGLASNATCMSLRKTYPNVAKAKYQVLTANSGGKLAIPAPDDPHGYVGANPSIIAALSDCLGFEYSISGIQFSGVVPAVASGRYDFAVASQYDTPERRKQVMYVDYLRVLEYVVVPKGNEHGIHSLDDTCGLRTFTQTGSVEVTLLAATSRKCEQSGKPPIKVMMLQGGSEFDAMLAGRADFVLQGSTAITGYSGTHPGKIERATKGVPSAAEGIQLPKSRTELAKALRDAMDVMYKTGVTANIFKKWQLEAQPLPPKITGAPGQ